MNKILLIGLGGIGSWTARFLSKAIYSGTLNAEITVADFDSVEPKNVKYADYTIGEIGKKKSEVIGTRYEFKTRDGYIRPRDHLEYLNQFDYIILAVDDNLFRSWVYTLIPKTRLIDVRTEGRVYCVFTGDSIRKSTLTKFANTVKENAPQTSDPEDRGSCQRLKRLMENKIDFVQIVAAAKTVQLLLNLIRGEDTVTEWIERV